MIRHNDLSLSCLESTPGGLARPGDPIVVLIHGRGADATDLGPLAEEIGGDAPYRFLLPDAPRRFSPAPGIELGYTWFDGYPPDPSSLEPSRKLLSRFLDEIEERYATDSSRLVLCGFSQGGLMALDAGLRREAGVAAIVVLSGGIDERNLPSEAIQTRPPVLMIHGTLDDAIPVELGRRTRQILTRSGLEPEYHELSIGHEISTEEVEMVRGFIRRVLNTER